MSSWTFLNLYIYDVISDVIMGEIVQNRIKSVSLAHLKQCEGSHNHVTASSILLLDTESIKCHLGPFGTDI